MKQKEREREREMYEVHFVHKDEVRRVKINTKPYYQDNHIYIYMHTLYNLFFILVSVPYVRYTASRTYLFFYVVHTSY